MITNLTLRQQQKIVNKEMKNDGWLFKTLKDAFQFEVYEIKDIRFLTDIDLVARYDKSRMIIDCVRVIDVRLQFIDYNATIHDSKDFKGPDEVLLDHVLIVLESELNQKRTYRLELLRDKEPKLFFSATAKADEYSLKRANYVRVK